MTSKQETSEQSASRNLDVAAELQRLRQEVFVLKAGFRGMVTDAANLCANVLRFKEALAAADAVKQSAEAHVLKGGSSEYLQEAVRIHEDLWRAIERDATEMQGRISALPKEYLGIEMLDISMGPEDGDLDTARAVDLFASQGSGSAAEGQNAQAGKGMGRSGSIRP